MSTCDTPRPPTRGDDQQPGSPEEGSRCVTGAAPDAFCEGVEAWQPPIVAALQRQVTRLAQDNLRLRTVMAAAADEILEQWDAHCDPEGFGPRNLLRHLQEGTGFYPGYIDAVTAADKKGEG